GLASGCTEETTSVFIEAAYFDPVATATTGRKLRINSDARYRFERGVDPEFTATGLEIATQLILDLCGGEASEVVEAGAPLKTARYYTLRPERVKGLVGLEVDTAVERGIGAVFVESSVSDRNIRALIEGAAARDHTVVIGGELYSDAMGARAADPSISARMLRSETELSTKTARMSRSTSMSTSSAMRCRPASLS
ncbi:MAG: phenylalanine--tRNA ligase beta subunit-related protein, partial [Pseudomonadota bacterium]